MNKPNIKDYTKSGTPDYESYAKALDMYIVGLEGDNPLSVIPDGFVIDVRLHKVVVKGKALVLINPDDFPKFKKAMKQKETK